jgi:hypothetical protein
MPIIVIDHDEIGSERGAGPKERGGAKPAPDRTNRINTI